MAEHGKTTFREPVAQPSSEMRWPPKNNVKPAGNTWLNKRSRNNWVAYMSL